LVDIKNVFNKSPTFGHLFEASPTMAFAAHGWALGRFLGLRSGRLSHGNGKVFAPDCDNDLLKNELRAIVGSFGWLSLTIGAILSDFGSAAAGSLPTAVLFR
jgi:hypothetical protein